jgi:acyl carrier protein
MHIADLEQKIKSFLAERLFIEFGEDVDEHSDLFQLGLIDSQAYMELIRFVESESKSKLTDEQILSNVFVSVSGIASLICDTLNRDRSADQS